MTCPGRDRRLLNSSLVRSAGADGLFAGIDWGNSFHQLCLVDPQGRIVHQARYDHDVAGLAGLTARLGRDGPVTGIAIERGEGLLVETLQDQGHRLFCVSPKMSARARERYRVAPGKSDAFDAFVLATRCAMSTGTGGRSRCPRRCWPSCGH